MLTKQAATPDRDCRGEGEAKIQKKNSKTFSQNTKYKILFFSKYKIQNTAKLFSQRNRKTYLFSSKTSFWKHLYFFTLISFVGMKGEIVDAAFIRLRY